MDDLDRKLLNRLQRGFPIDPEPYRIVGEALGISEDEAFSRVKRLKEQGVIRRIGAVFEPGRLGFVSTLCAARVPPERLEVFIETVNACEGVTHNYERNHSYNVWFTVIAPSPEKIEDFLRDLREKTGLSDILDLRSVKKFKIDATFDL